MTLVLAAAEGGTNPALGAAGAAAAGAVGALGAVAGGVEARRRTRRNDLEAAEAAAQLAVRERKLEDIYFDVLRRAEKRASWAFGAALGSGFLTAVALGVGGYLGLRFGTPVEAIIPGAGGLMSGGMTAYFGQLAKSSREDRKEMFDKLAESWEKDRDAERKIRVAREIEEHAQDLAADAGYAAGKRAAEEVNLPVPPGTDSQGGEADRIALNYQSEFAKDIDRSMPWSSPGVGSPEALHKLISDLEAQAAKLDESTAAARQVLRSAESAAKGADRSPPEPA